MAVHKTEYNRFLYQEQVLFATNYKIQKYVDSSNKNRNNTVTEKHLWPVQQATKHRPLVPKWLSLCGTEPEGDDLTLPVLPRNH